MGTILLFKIFLIHNSFDWYKLLIHNESLDAIKRELDVKL